MKCVKSKSTSKIERVTDTTAVKLVNSGQYTYCPKREYKQQQERISSNAQQTD